MARKRHRDDEVEAPLSLEVEECVNLTPKLHEWRWADADQFDSPRLRVVPDVQLLKTLRKKQAARLQRPRQALALCGSCTEALVAVQDGCSLRRLSFELSTPELQDLYGNSEHLDPRSALIARSSPSRLKFDSPVVEMRTRKDLDGVWVRCAEGLHLVTPAGGDCEYAVRASHDSSYDVRQVCLQPFSHEQVALISLAGVHVLAADLAAEVSVLNLYEDSPPNFASRLVPTANGTSLHLLDLFSGETQMMWKTSACASEFMNFGDLAINPFRPHQFAATQCGPCHVLLMFDIRNTTRPFGQLMLPDGAALARDRGPLKNRFFQLQFSSTGSERWLTAACLGGRGLVGLSWAESDDITQSLYSTQMALEGPGICAGSLVPTASADGRHGSALLAFMDDGEAFRGCWLQAPGAAQQARPEEPRTGALRAVASAGRPRRAAWEAPQEKSLDMVQVESCLRWIESESTALCAVLDRCGLVCFQPLPDPEPEGLDALWHRKHAVQEGDYDTDFLEKDPALGQPEEPQDEVVADALAAGQPELAAHLPVTRRARQALAYLNAASLPLGWTFRETAGFVGVQDVSELSRLAHAHSTRRLLPPDECTRMSVQVILRALARVGVLRCATPWEVEETSEYNPEAYISAVSAPHELMEAQLGDTLVRAEAAALHPQVRSLSRRLGARDQASLASQEPGDAMQAMLLKLLCLDGPDLGWTQPIRFPGDQPGPSFGEAAPFSVTDADEWAKVVQKAKSSQEVGQAVWQRIVGCLAMQDIGQLAVWLRREKRLRFQSAGGQQLMRIKEPSKKSKVELFRRALAAAYRNVRGDGPGLAIIQSSACNPRRGAWREPGVWPEYASAVKSFRSAMTASTARDSKMDVELAERVPLMEALRELQKENAALRSELQSLGARVAALEGLKTEDGQTAGFWEEEVPVQMGENAWNILVVVGLTDAGIWDVSFSLLLYLGNIMMQGTFIGILLGHSFLGDPFETNVENTSVWRNKIAHSFQYVDLAETSLVTRVCDEDSSLIHASSQAKLLSDINKYLGLHKAAFEATLEQPGVTLCMLCMALWSLCVFIELRDIWLHLQAMMQVPRAERTELRKGTFVSISVNRFRLIVASCLLRAVLAIALLVAGLQWLGGTTSIADLILNAVALNTILDIDDFVFQAVMPTKIQLTLRGLEPIPLRYTPHRSQVESAFHFLALVLMLLIPYTVLVVPLSHHMLEVKREMCFGIQNFVVAYNSDVGMTYGLMSRGAGDAHDTLAELAVESYKFKMNNPWSPNNGADPPAPKYMQLSLGIQEFEFGRIRKMADEAEYFPVCWEKDVNPDDKSDASISSLNAIARGRMNAAAFDLNSKATTCKELKESCYLPQARMLRLMCGETCGCTDAMSSPWYKVQAEGCAGRCLAERTVQIKDLPCQDFPQASAEDGWNHFWDNLDDVFSEFFGPNRMPYGKEDLEKIASIKAGGCPKLKANPIDKLTGESLCEGMAELFGPLAYLCPDFFRETWPQMQEVLDSILAASDKPLEALAELTVPSDETALLARASCSRRRFKRRKLAETESILRCTAGDRAGKAAPPIRIRVPFAAALKVKTDGDARGDATPAPEASNMALSPAASGQLSDPGPGPRPSSPWKLPSWRWLAALPNSRWGRPQRSERAMGGALSRKPAGPGGALEANGWVGLHPMAFMCVPVRTAVFLGGLSCAGLGLFLLRWPQAVEEDRRAFVGGYSDWSRALIDVLELSAILWGSLGAVGALYMKENFLRAFFYYEVVRVAAWLLTYLLDAPLLVNCELGRDDPSAFVARFGPNKAMLGIAADGSCDDERAFFGLLSPLCLLFFLQFLFATQRLLVDFEDDPRYLLNIPKEGPTGAFHSRNMASGSDIAEQFAQTGLPSAGPPATVATPLMAAPHGASRPPDLALENFASSGV
eukprot:s332_g3.t15